jgi:hypothetical protein
MLSREDYSKSIEYLESMVFWDPLYSREDIHLYRADTWILRYQRGEGGITDVLDAFRHMVQSYPDSASIGFYRYRYAFYLFAAGDISGARAQIDRINGENLSSRLKNEVDALSGKIDEASD